MLQKLISCFTGTNPDQAKTEEPKPGEVWYLDGDENGDPFPPKRNWFPVKIIDVRSGWVRYNMGLVFTDERMNIESFMRMYVKSKG